jgi:hypothetical protein
MVFVHENHLESFFALISNIMHSSSTKCKRIIRSTLALEVYGIMNEIDVGITLATTLKIIITRFNLPEIPLVICTNLYFLYECLVKLGITQEKRLMIDILALGQFYKRKKIAEIRWIYSCDNSANALIKAIANSSLKQLISISKLVVKIKEYIERPFAGNKIAA